MSICGRCGAKLQPGVGACTACAPAGGAAACPFAAAGLAPPTVFAQQQKQRQGRWERVRFHVRRALSWDLRNVAVEEDERARLIALSVDEEDARRYLCWRRSVLKVVAWPTLVSAVLALLGSLISDQSGLSGVGLLLEFIRLAALFALPVTAFLAARCWDRHRRSRTILTRGWMVAFLTPLVLALFPFSWRVDLSGNDATVAAQAENLISLLGAVSVYVTLMPAVLSLIPGVLRACLRVKALLPQSILPGWFLVAATPLYVLLFLVIFSTVNQLAGHALLLVAVLALLGAPMFYIANAGTFTRPLHTEEEIARIGQIQRTVGLVTAFGIVLLFVYAFQAQVMGQALIGVDEETSWIRPWDPNLFQFPLEYVVRSLFTTVLVADLFMLMNLSVWQHTKAFLASERAGSYDRLMCEIEEAGSQD